MRGGGLILALIVGAVFVALYAPLLFKASNELRSYRPDAFRSDVETAAIGGLGNAGNHNGFHNHNLLPVLSAGSEASV